MRRPVLLALAAALLAPAPQAQGARVRTWTSAAEELPRGKAESMAWTRRGRLFLSPRITALGGSQTPQGPAQIWAMTSDRSGQIFLGTGPEGQVLAIGRSKEPRLYFVVEEPMVTALAVGPGGMLYAGSAPGGVIYRITGQGAGEPWAYTEERYVWSLVFGADGSLFAGTGERGRILRIDPTGEARELFDTRESHVVSLDVAGDGGLLAGGAGRGLVYRVDAEGHALVLHDDGLPEVVALAEEADGSVLAALVAPGETPARRPTLRLRLPDGTEVGTTDEAVGTLEESSGPTLRGSIEGLPAPPTEPERVTGRVVRIDPAGVATELWSSTRESPFCMARDTRGRMLFGTGEPARLYRIEPDGDVALLTTLREAQLTGLLQAERSVLLATSNPAAAYRLDDTPAESGSFESRPLDAGGPARWGSIRWRVEGRETGSDRTELYTRTGNSREPDASWSAWSPALTDPAEGRIVNPDGRFLQWRVRQVGEAEQVDGVSVIYEPYNRAPRFESASLRGPSGPSVDEKKTIRWSVVDPDGDPMDVSLEYRPPGADAWATATGPASTTGGDGPTPATVKGELIWDTAGVPEGEYEVRVLATDAAANPPGEGLETEDGSVRRVVVDRTPPEITVLESREGMARVEVADSLSPVRSLELVKDGRTRFTARAEDGVCDQTTETFRVEIAPAGGGAWSMRGIDAAGNAVERPWPPAGSLNEP